MDGPLPADCAARYDHVRFLGRGGFGTVHLATHRDTGQEVAIKVLSPAVADNQKSVRRFVHEARLIARLSHPNIVAMLEHGAAELPWIALEYVPGGTLRKHLKEYGAMPWADALAVARQLAGALAEAHDKGILHRDIKPENILVAGPGTYKIADFGVSKCVDPDWTPLTSASVIVGSLRYVAPELLDGQPVTARADLYALGVVLYEMSTGSRFLASTPREEMYDAIRHAVVPTPGALVETIPPEFDRLVMQCMARSPGDRHESAAALIARIDHLLPQVPALLARTPADQAEARRRMAADAPAARPHHDASEAEAPPGRGRRRLVIAVLAVLALAALAWALCCGRPDRSRLTGGPCPERLLLESRARPDDDRARRRKELPCDSRPCRSSFSCWLRPGLWPRSPTTRSRCGWPGAS